MSRWEGKVAVVTGASAGIGLAIAEAFVHCGMIVVGLARKKANMETAMRFAQGNGKFIVRECDVSNHRNLKDVFQWIQDNVGVIQIMVNNAGILINGTIAETSREDWEKVFDVNVIGLLECTKYAVKMMKAANVEGHIVNINSIQGHRTRNFGSNLHVNVYAASKHAVTAITQTLQQELHGDNIRVTSISPGFVKTDILKHANVCIKSMNAFSSGPALESKDIADAVVYVIETPQHVEITELTLRCLGEKECLE